MKRLGLFFLLLCLCLPSRTNAQENHRWTIGFSASYARLDPVFSDKGLVFLPSLRYHLDRDWSLGLSLHLPDANKNHNLAILYTTGAEVGLRREVELFPRLRLGLSAIALIGLTGPYTAIKLPYDTSSVPSERPYYSADIDYQSIRWQVGLRPSLSYRFAKAWGVELSYGFLGYRSHEDLWTNAIINGKRPKGAWAWNDQFGWGNALRFGLTYSF